MVCVFFFFKQKTAYDMRISDWSSDVCSSDLSGSREQGLEGTDREVGAVLVIDIPEGALGEDAGRIRDLEEDDRPLAALELVAHHADERADLRYVLQRHLAADEVGIRRRGVICEEFPEHADPPGIGRLQALGMEAGIVAQALITAQVAEEGEEFALAAARSEEH